MLLERGHSQAARYPLWRLWMEAEIVKDRIHGLLVSEAILFQHAAASIMSKEGAKAFKELVETLTNG